MLDRAILVDIGSDKTPAELLAELLAAADAADRAEATATNGGAITAATDVAHAMPAGEYRFDESPYENRVYYGFGKADPSVELVIGPNITDFPPIPEWAPNILLELSAVIQDEVTTTDDLMPSGATTSYRSNPLRLAGIPCPDGCRDMPPSATPFTMWKRTGSRGKNRRNRWRFCGASATPMH